MQTATSIPFHSKICIQYEIIQEQERSKNIKYTEIEKEVLDQFGITRTQFISKNRKMELCLARQIFWTISAKLFASKGTVTKVYDYLGKLTGNRDRSSVIHGIHRLKCLCFEFHSLEKLTNDIRRRILGHELAINSNAMQLVLAEMCAKYSKKKEIPLVAVTQDEQEDPKKTEHKKDNHYSYNGERHRENYSA